MTNKQALIDLRDKVKAGVDPHAIDITGRKIASKERDSGRTFDWLGVLNAYKGSLDAAKALHESALKGWDFSLGVEYAEVADYPNRCGVYFIANNEIPARAWLLAILEALIDSCIDTPPDPERE